MGDRSLHQFVSSTGAGVRTCNSGRGTKPVAREVGGATSGAGRGIGVPSGDLVRGSLNAKVHVVGVGVEGAVFLFVGSTGACECAENLCSGFGRGKLSASK